MLPYSQENNFLQEAQNCRQAIVMFLLLPLHLPPNYAKLLFPNLETYQLPQQSPYVSHLLDLECYADCILYPHSVCPFDLKDYKLFTPSFWLWWYTNY